MIAALSGKLLQKYNDRVVVDVSGVGYEVYVSTNCISRLPDLGDDVFLHIHTHVREDILVLFGFLEKQEKELFLMLKKVVGVGPKLALAMLSGMTASELCRAIAEGDSKRLTALPGVGKKTVERICLELADKMGQLVSDSSQAGIVAVASAQPGSAIYDVLSALDNLGYAELVARQALTTVKKHVGEEAFTAMSFEDMIKEALRALT